MKGARGHRCMQLPLALLRRRAQERENTHLTNLYASLVQANQAMLRATDEADLFQDICRICVEFGPFGLVWLAVLKEGQPCIVAAAGPMQGYLDGLALSADPADPLGQGPSGRAFHGESVICANWAEDPQVAPWRERAARFGIRSSGSFPVRTQHRVEAVLSLYSDQAGLFHPDKIHLLEELTSDIAFAMDKFRLERQRLAAEAALREEERIYQDLVKALPAGVYRLRVQPVPASVAFDWGGAFLSTYEIEFVSDRFCEITSLDCEAFKSNPGLILDRIHPEDRAEFTARNAEAVTQLVPFLWEGRLVSEGPPRWIRFESLPRLLPEGGSIWTGVLTDISDHKKEEDASRRMHRLLRQAEAIAKVGGWEIDLEAGTLFWSEEVFRIHELDPRFYTPTIDSSIQFYAPEWRPVISQALQRAIETGEDFDLDLEILTASGRRLWVHATTQIVKRDDRVVKVLGAFRDITQERLAAADMAKNHALLSGIMESADGPIFSVDRDYRYTSFNQAHAATMKALYGREVSLGASPLDIQVVPADHYHSKAGLDRALAGEIFTEEFLAGDEPLSRRWFLVTRTPVRSADGAVVGVASFARDITQRRLAEAEMNRVTELLSQVGRIAGVGGWELDLETQSLYWTDQTYAIHDLDPSTYTPTVATAIQFYAPEWRPVITQAVQTAIETGRAFDLELEVITAKGRRIWVHATSQVVTRDGRVVKMLGAFQDISERKWNEEALRESNQRLQLATDSAHMAVYDWDLQAGTMTWDDRMFELYGTTRLETQGTVLDWKDGLHPEDLDRAVRECEAALRGEAPFDTEFRIRHRNGTVLWIKADATVLRDLEGHAVRMVGVNRDITEWKRMETEIRNLNRGLERRVVQRTHQLELAKDELEAFAYSVSHDLRAPLRAISGFTAALLQDGNSSLSADGAVHLQRIQAGTTRMAQIIEDLLKLSRIGQDDCTLMPLDLASLADQVLAGLRAAEPERRVDCQVQHPIPVQGDPRLLRLLLENLLGNAWKFTSRVAAARIEMEAHSLGEAMVEISIRDNGAGFPQAQAGKLFRPFHRQHRESDYPGTGIGLAIARRVVGRHGGHIRAEGEVGLGAVFQFTLPVLHEELP